MNTVKINIYDSRDSSGNLTENTYANVVLPFKYGKFLDEQLDYAVITLERVPKKRFDLMTFLKYIVVSSNQTVERIESSEMLIVGDESFESPVGSGLYKHEITVIEATKLAEGIQVESLCFTNANGNTYNAAPNPPEIIGSDDLDIQLYPSNYVTPSVVGTTYNLLGVSINETTTRIEIIIKNNSGEKKLFDSEEKNYGSLNALNADIKSTTFTIEEGENTILYRWSFRATDRIDGERRFTIDGLLNRLPLKPWTNKEVISRVLELAEPLRENEPARFTLSETSPGVSEEDLEALAPEYTFTRMNLREIMQTIGGTMHAEPRLNLLISDDYKGVWTFEKYGKTTLAEYKNYKTNVVKPLNEYKYTTYKRNHEIEQACNKLDGYIDNLVNRVDWESSTVSNVSENVRFGKRLRTESVYVRIEENNDETMLVTEYPIDRVKRIEAVYRGTVNSEEGVAIVKDITSFLYEKKVYNNLSSYSSSQKSKAFALYYAQGEKNIKGFFFKVPNATGGIFDNYSIINILKAVGYPLEVLEGNGSTKDYMLLELRVQYVPVYSTRVQHSKQYLSDYLPTGRTINYSQSNNSVETRFYGENIKGVTQRLGTVEKYVTFVLRHNYNIPNAGDLWDSDFYITSIQVSVLRDHFEVTCGLSKNFNRKSKYIGVQSHKRVYEVSETMVQQRHTVLSDYIVIETEKSALHKTESNYVANVENYGQQFLSPYAFSYCWTAIFDGKESGRTAGTKVQSVNLRGYSYQHNGVQPYSITVPVVSASFGNVIECTCECKDNFSAGVAERRIELFTGTPNYFTEEIEYGDHYGRAYYLSYKLINDGVYSVGNEEDASAFLPREVRLNIGEEYASTSNFRHEGQKYLLYRKDGRESLKISYILETVAGDDSLIIGSALQTLNPIITNNQNNWFHKAVYCVLSRELGKFEERIDTNADYVLAKYSMGDVVRSSNDTFAYFDNLPTFAREGEIGKSWCIVYPSYEGESVRVSTEKGEETLYKEKLGGEILVGRNETLKGDEMPTFGKLYMYCVHDIHKYITAKKKAGKL